MHYIITNRQDDSKFVVLQRKGKFTKDESSVDTSRKACKIAENQEIYVQEMTNASVAEKKSKRDWGGHKMCL